MNSIKAILLGLALAAGAPGTADARTFKEMFPSEKIENPKAKEFLDALDFRQGDVKIDGIGVRLNVGPKFYFLGQADARKVIVDVWGNPPVTGEKTLGMIMPSDKTPVDDSWGAIITFDEDGYVSDEEAAKIDYTQLLKDMQEGTEEASKERVKNGFQSLRLVGWASQPFYDKSSNKLHWAKELEFGGNPKHTLNYDVRALGRKGVLKMNFVAGMDDLSVIKTVIPAVMAMPEFEQGFRYADYVPGTDKVAAYGIGGLIAGKVLAKAGLLAVALAFLKKGWIIILLGGGWLLKQLGGLLGRNKAPPPST